eukprot:15435588-Alexandrium_andersonii.AAC.1
MVRCATVRSTPLSCWTSKSGMSEARVCCSRSPAGSSCFPAQSRAGATPGYWPGRKARSLLFQSLRPLGLRLQ